MAETMSKSVPSDAKRYDVVIVGGGTAGCVLAARLSEIESVEVLLLEAGGDQNDDPRVKIPMLFGQAIGDSTLDWDHHSIPQTQLDDKSVVHPRGKGLGGSSLINLLALIYPSKSTYDAWAAAGNPGWEWSSMIPYLKKFQTYNQPSEDVREALGLGNINPTAQGKNGPVQASHPLEAHPLDKAWIDAFKTMGHSMTSDTMSGNCVGAFSIASAIEPTSRERSHAGVAYLLMARARPNLTIVTNAAVHKISLTGSKATGVEYSRAGEILSVQATKEIILCCGTFQSPALLERSGIGRAEILQNLGVAPVVLNESVGENLQDHIFAACSFEVEDGVDTTDSFRDADYIQKAMGEYQQNRSGPLAASFVSQAYLPLVNGIDGMDVDSILASYRGPRTAAFKVAEDFMSRLVKDNKEASAAFLLTRGQVHLEHNTMGAMFGPTDPGKYLTLWTALNHPLSRGNVHAKSLDVGDISIDPRYYSHPLDAELMARHLRAFDQILSTQPFQAVLKPNGRRIPEWAAFDSSEGTKRLYTQSNMSFYHPVGSCSMLPEKDGGVVDDQLRVYGIQGLRVCDASVMPVVPGGPIMSSVYAIAEKGADMIKHDLGVAI